MASQLRQPHGWFGERIMSRMLDRVNRRIVDSTLGLLQLEPQQHVLEIGFGGGYALSRLLQELSHGRVAGVDVSSEMLAGAKRRFAAELASGRLQVQSADVARLPFPDAAFDRVFTVNTIYFWQDVAKGMAEIRRVLKPGGLAAISIRSKERMEKSALTKYDSFDRLFSPDELKRALVQAGFSDIRVDHQDDGRFWDQVVAVGMK